MGWAPAVSGSCPTEGRTALACSSARGGSGPRGRQAPRGGTRGKLSGGQGVPAVDGRSCASVDAVANHIPAGWPSESPPGSDSEEPGDQPRLKVETKVSVELHLDEQGNHCGERPPEQESSGPLRPAGVLPGQPPEQRKGALGVGRPRCSRGAGGPGSPSAGEGTEAGRVGRGRGPGGDREQRGGAGVECRWSGTEVQVGGGRGSGQDGRGEGPMWGLGLGGMLGGGPSARWWGGRGAGAAGAGGSGSPRVCFPSTGVTFGPAACR